MIAAELEAECGALYNNSKIFIPLCMTIEDIIWTQVITPTTKDNSTAYDVIKKSSNQKQISLGIEVLLWA